MCKGQTVRAGHRRPRGGRSSGGRASGAAPAPRPALPPSPAPRRAASSRLSRADTARRTPGGSGGCGPWRVAPLRHVERASALAWLPEAQGPAWRTPHAGPPLPAAAPLRRPPPAASRRRPPCRLVRPLRRRRRVRRRHWRRRQGVPPAAWAALPRIPARARRILSRGGGRGWSRTKTHQEPPHLRGCVSAPTMCRPRER